MIFLFQTTENNWSLKLGLILLEKKKVKISYLGSTWEHKHWVDKGLMFSY